MIALTDILAGFSKPCYLSPSRWPQRVDQLFSNTIFDQSEVMDKELDRVCMQCLPSSKDELCLGKAMMG